jgi:hypothetical protein
MAIISFRHRFIFIKTRKTAGTSLEVHLGRHCGAEDIVTPVYPENEGHTPRNYQLDGKVAYYNHMPATHIRQLQPLVFSTFFKFCFERHPVDKCLSDFAMLINSEYHKDPSKPRTWEEYVERGDFPVDANKYCYEDGRPIVDGIYKYEELETALADVGSRLGLRLGPLIEREKAGFRHGVPTVQEVMDRASQRDHIFAAFEASLKIVGYR